MFVVNNGCGSIDSIDHVSEQSVSCEFQTTRLKDGFPLRS